MNIVRIDHIGLRVLDFARSKAYYQLFGFKAIREDGDEGIVVMRHPAGMELNLLNNSSCKMITRNVLMDEKEKYPGFTHIALEVDSIRPVIDFLNSVDIEITEGPVTFGDGKTSVFIRDPDLNVLEFTSTMDIQ